MMTVVERVRLDSENRFRDILVRVDEISFDHIIDTHFVRLRKV